MDYSLDDRIEILGLSEQRIGELKTIPVKLIQNGNYIGKPEERIIDVDKVVGLNQRYEEPKNWIELLSNLHKMRNFINFNIEKFDDFLLNAVNDLPSVTLYNGEYYISGNGKHRLTMAKCIGYKKAKVIVSFVQ